MKGAINEGTLAEDTGQGEEIEAGRCGNYKRFV